MLFSRMPKAVRKDFFDREEELKRFVSGLASGEGLIVVCGVRRVGKTSLVRVGLREAGVPHVVIDVRRYAEVPKMLSPSAVAVVVDEALKRYRGFGRSIHAKIDRVLSYVESIDLKAVSLRLRRREGKDLADVLEEADGWAESIGKRFAVVIDEAQGLRAVPSWVDLIGWSLDTLSNVAFVVIGSEVGVLMDFLRLDDRGSPLFGRPRLEIHLGKFTDEQSLDFLRAGFAEVGMVVEPRELEEVVESIDGIVGWLTLYGYYRTVQRKNHREALEEVRREATELVTGELEKLVRYSPKRYIAVLWAISLGLKTWSTIKHYAEGVVGYIPDSKFNKILSNLVKYGFVEKTANLEYVLVDPLIPTAIEKLRHKYRI
jgi:hypothetical protein